MNSYVFKIFKIPIDNNNHYQLYLIIDEFIKEKTRFSLVFKYYCSLRLKRLAAIRAPNPITAKFVVS